MLLFRLWVESPDAFYSSLLLTDVLQRIDAIQRLPQSLYTMLFHVAVYSRDSTASARACTLFFELCASHANDGDVTMFFPLSSNYLLVWERLCMWMFAFVSVDYASMKGIDFPQFFSTHLQTKEYVDSDGSILPGLFPRWLVDWS